ncbi:MAG: hypothetical protein AB7H43_13690 [Acidimicrobiia bacterium]
MSLPRRAALALTCLIAALVAVLALPLAASTAAAAPAPVVPVGPQYAHEPTAAQFTRSNVAIYQCARAACPVIAHAGATDRVSVDCWSHHVGSADFTPYRYGVTVNYHDPAHRTYGYAAVADVELLDGPVSHCTGAVGLRPYDEG